MKRSSSMRTRVIALAALGLSACSGSSEPHHAGDAGSSDGEIVVLTSTVVAFASTYTALSVGSTHACGIRADGTIDCWGQPQHGAEPPPEGRFRAVASFQQDCAIATDGTVACWGPGGNGETQPPPGTFTALAAGSMFTCGLMTSGALRCWGRIDPPPAGTFTAIAAGSSSACAIDTDGAVACWGLGGLTLPGRYVQIAMNDRMVCGLTSASRMACSGGDALLGPFSAIAVADTACGVRPDGTITCGGRFGAVNAQDPPPGRYEQLAARDSILCALEEGEVRCWGGLLTNLASARRRHSQWLDVGVSVMFGSGIDGARGCGIAADGTRRLRPYLRDPRRWRPRMLGWLSGRFIPQSAARRCVHGRRRLRRLRLRDRRRRDAPLLGRAHGTRADRGTERDLHAGPLRCLPRLCDRDRRHHQLLG